MRSPSGRGPGQGPAADAAVDGQGGRGQVGRVDRNLPVPELAEVKVALAVVEADRPQPAQEDVAGRLHDPLAIDHPLALVRDLAFPGEGGEHRVLGLFYLQEDRVGVPTAHEQQYPAPGPTLPTPTTFLAMSTMRYCSSRWRRSACRVRR